MFMGTPHFAVPALQGIHEAGHEIVAVVTAPDRPAGRGQKLLPSPIKEFAQTQGFEVLQPTNLKSDSFRADLERTIPAVIVVVAFRMLPESVWAFPENGTLNLHASLLPNYRGAAPINWAVMNGETETGLTTFFIDKQIDTGRVIMQEHLAIGLDETAGELHDRMMVAGAGLLTRTLASIAEGTVIPIDQNDMIKGELSKAPKIFKPDCRIDWSSSAQRVHNHIRGLSPYPTAWTMLGDLSTKVFRSRMTDRISGSPGVVTIENDKLFISCSDGVLEIIELQTAGKKRMKTGDFLRGFNPPSDLKAE